MFSLILALISISAMSTDKIQEIESLNDPIIIQLYMGESNPSKIAGEGIDDVCWDNVGVFLPSLCKAPLTKCSFVKKFSISSGSETLLEKIDPSSEFSAGHLVWREVGYFEDEGLDFTTNEKVFSSIQKIILNGKDATEEFHIKYGALVAKDKNNFKKKYQNVPVHSIEFAGSCSNVSPYNSLRDYSIYETPDLKSNVSGEIKILSTEENVAKVIVLLEKSKKEFVFNPSIWNGDCSGSKDSRPTVLHQGRATKEQFVNIGNGPWGNSGWIVAPFQKFSSSSMIWKLSGETVSFTKDNKGNMVAQGSRHNPKLPYKKDDPESQSEDFREIVPLSKIINSKGDLLIRPDCTVYGC